MNSDHRDPRPDPLRFEKEDLDGHTLEELTDYLEAGRSPVDRSIEESAGCRIALDALERLHGLSADLQAHDTAAEPAADDAWVHRILEGIALDVRSGRRIPIGEPTADADLAITEGALRGVIRAAERAVPGVVIGRCRLDGDVEAVGAPVRIRVDASVPYGQPLPDAARALRDAISRDLAAHVDLDITAVDITIHDIQALPRAAEEDR
ncbi:hypothetical protein [Microbacterium sp. G2-8]|uniref:hypothetical protein n=1 Tax=Microbacterium sp. G2-8 TaxID=2842454 RepID=UPI001C8A5129|nr:hypothetical protein [Microbacterium sp. G2-8]